MAEERLCLACGAWWLRVDDAFCSYCASPCAQLSLITSPAVLHVGHRPPRLLARLTNHSCATLALESLTLPPWLSSPLHPAQLLPGQVFSWSSLADYASVRSPQAGCIRASTSAGEAENEVLWVAEKPSLTVSPARVEVWAGCDAIANHAPLTLFSAVGKLRIRGVSVGGTARLLPANTRVECPLPSAGQLASPDEGVSLSFHYDARKSDVGVAEQAILVTYDSPHGPAQTRVPLPVSVLHPPELRWDDQHRRPVLLHPTNHQRLSFTFKNQSPDGRSGGGENAPLVITSCELLPPAGLAIASRLLAPPPESLSGGHTWVAECELDLQSMRGESARQVELQLHVVTNLPALHSPVTIQIEPLQPRDGIVAIDFGSSNSCCAVLEPGGDLQLIPLDRDAPVSPTLLSYLSLNEPPEVETGAHIKRAVEDEERAASTADRLKQRLGDERQTLSVRPKNARHWLTREAGQAATDYLRDIRQAIERARNGTFDDFVLTHPARCSLRQYQRLRQALVQAFDSPGARISFLQEPIAALIPYMVERAAQPGSEPYTIASFDLGGGTTDIALIHVTYQSPQPGTVHILPSIVYCRGLNFGGEDLSDFLVAELRRRCASFLSAGHPGAKLIDEGVPGTAALDVRRNRAALLQAAEQFKASLSGRSPEPDAIPLRVLLPQGVTTTINADFRPIRSSVGGDLAKLFTAHTHAEVSRAAHLLLCALRDEASIRLDVIQLSGMTTFLPIVRETLAGLFPSVRLVRPVDPKECVVRGACLSRSMLRGPILLRLPPSQRMTSTIGLFPLTGGVFQAIFKVDSVIPPEGLEQIVPTFWDGDESILLWEDLNDTHTPVPYSAAAALLNRIGSWKPQRRLALAPEQRWPIRVTLRDLELQVQALDPAGGSIAFTPPQGA